MNRRIRFSLFTFLLVCTLISVAVGMSLRTPPPAKLAIQIVGNDYHGDTTKTGIRIFRPESHFHVVITNQSERNVRLWEEWNSWGYFNLTFDIVNKEGKKTGSIQKTPTVWTRNFPSHVELAPNEHHVIDVYLNPKQWEIPIKPMGEREGPTDYRLIARYKINECAESKEHSIWNGMIETGPVDIKLGYWPK